MKSNQRTILSRLYGSNKRYDFKAVFDHMSFRKDEQNRTHLTALLTDLYVLLNGQSIYAADHVWIDVPKEMFSLKYELAGSDKLNFKAEIEEYRITRADLIEKRNQIWNEAKAQNRAMYAAVKAGRQNMTAQQYSARRAEAAAHMHGQYRTCQTAAEKHKNG